MPGRTQCTTSRSKLRHYPKYPALASQDVILEVRNVPMPIAQKEFDEYAGIEIFSGATSAVNAAPDDRQSVLDAARAALAVLTAEERAMIVAEMR